MPNIRSSSPSYNGVSITNVDGRFISGLSLTGRTSITIGGLSLSLTSATTYEPVRLSYSDGISTTLFETCLMFNGNSQVYQLSSDNLLYLDGQAGTTLVPSGIYSDGGKIFIWDGNTLNTYGGCPKYVRFGSITNIVDPIVGNTLQYQYSSQVSDVGARYRFSYNLNPGEFLELYYKISTGAEYPYDGEYDTTAPKYQSPGFTFVEPVGSQFATEISPYPGEYVSLGFNSNGLSSGVNTEVTVEIKLPGTTTWYPYTSFSISNQ